MDPSLTIHLSLQKQEKKGVNRTTIWNFQEKGGRWKQQNRIALPANVADRELGPGVYVIALGRQILYVGESGRGLKRTQDGFLLPINQSAAYKWRAGSGLVGHQLECSYYDTLDRDAYWKVKKHRQSLEADVAAAVRMQTGQWPSALTRIDLHGALQRLELVHASVRYIMEDLDRRGRIAASETPT